MEHEKTTLKDIAAALGVSATTVHRALTGKPGISGALRATIRETASRMGYETNLAASALKRRALRIFVVLPEPLLDNRYYYAQLWSGIRRFTEENKSFAVKLTERYYSLTGGGQGSALRELCEKQLTEIDGLITLGSGDSQASYFLGRFSQAGIPFVTLGSDLRGDSRLCCVKACDEMAGSLAAELFTAFLPSGCTGSILLTGNPTGQAAMPDQYRNLAAFQDLVSRRAPGFTLRTAYCADTEQLEELAAPFLNGTAASPLFGIYAASARHTVKMCRLLEQYGLSGTVRFIGSDRFPESMDFLRRGVLTAVIDKQVSLQAWRAAAILTEHLTMGQYPDHEVVELRPEILMRSSLPQM